MALSRQKFRYLVPLLAFAIFPSAGKTLDDIRRSFTRSWTANADQRREWFTPRGGEKWGLPPDVVSAVKLLRGENAPDYRYSAAFAKYHEQRLKEGAYPLLNQEKSLWLVALTTEETPPCETKATDGGVKLVYCP